MYSFYALFNSCKSISRSFQIRFLNLSFIPLKSIKKLTVSYSYSGRKMVFLIIIIIMIIKELPYETLFVKIKRKA